jgi:hypothetical protein
VDATSTANAVATLESATAQAREGATQAAQSTQEAAVKETASAVATVTAVAAAQGTATARVTSTAIALKTKDALERKAQAESTLAAKRTAMAAVSFKKTAQAESVADFIKQLVEQRYVTKTEGIYHPLDNFDESWAQINWYKWWKTNYNPRDFVIRADVTWTSASDIANWFNSGCGFVFSAKDRDNHHLVFFALDGNVYLAQVKNGYTREIGSGYYGSVDLPTGSAKIMLVVEGQLISFFVNDTRVLRASDTTITEGNLAPTLLSGTNKSFGTRCKMTNIDLWMMK